MLYVIGVLFMALLAAGGFASCEHKRANSLEVAIEANKATAKLVLESETAKVAAKEKADKEFSITIQGDYEKSLKTLDVTNRDLRKRLSDPNRSSCAPSLAGADSPALKAGTDEQELPRVTSNFLFSEAERADKLRLWAQSCYEFINRQSIKSKTEALSDDK